MSLRSSMESTRNDRNSDPGGELWKLGKGATSGPGHQRLQFRAFSHARSWRSRAKPGTQLAKPLAARLPFR